MIRVYKLSEIPSVINGDETGSILHPLEIMFQKNGNFFNLTHDGSVSYTIYLFKYLSIKLFGIERSMLAVRLITATLATASLIPFYLIIKSYVNKNIALLMAFAFSSNYWFLNFSRLSWINIDCLFPGLLLLLCTKKVLEKRSIKYYVLLGILSAIVLYNYMGGRIYAIATYTVLLIDTLKKSSFQKIIKLKSLVISGLIALTIFSPQLFVALKKPTQYLLRPSSLYVFNQKNSYYNIPPSNKFQIIKHQLVYATKGLIFFDENVSSEGFENPRYVPPKSACINSIIKILFWFGLIAYFTKKGGSFLWLLVYLLNILIFQLPSIYIPNWSRGIAIIPIIYFFASVGLQCIVQHFKKLSSVYYLPITSIIFTLIILGAISDTKKYFGWVKSQSFHNAQQPAIDIKDLEKWLSIQKTRIESGERTIFNHEWNKIYSTR